MNTRTRRAALGAIGAIALLASIDALAHSYAGLYGWALHHRLTGWQAWSWPAEIDVFLVVGELALYVAYLDSWPGREKAWPWATAVTGLLVSLAGNVGHVQPLAGMPVTTADRITAATSPLAAFAGLMIGLLVLKMSQRRPVREESAAEAGDGHVIALSNDSFAEEPFAMPRELALSPAPVLACSRNLQLLQDAEEIIEAARVTGQRISQRALAAELRERGHRFSNTQLRSLAAGRPSLTPDQRAA